MILALLLLFVNSIGIESTYSIVAADLENNQVGGSGASCVDFGLYDALYNGVPGKGVMHSQAFVSDADKMRELAMELIENEVDPSEIINAITQESVDNYTFDGLPGPTLRQYGIVDLQNRSSGYTGSNIEFVYENFFLVYGTDESDRQGNTKNFVYSIQGNIVTNETLPRTEEAFLNNSGCDLADRLMRALLAGGSNGQGDHRCRSQSKDTSSDSAFLHVDNADGTIFVHLNVTTTEEEPLLKLKALYDAWRIDSEPCADYVPFNVSFASTGSIPSFFTLSWCLLTLVMFLV